MAILAIECRLTIIGSMEMTTTNGFAIIDNALSLAVADLKKLGLPEDEAHSTLIRLKHLVPTEVSRLLICYRKMTR